MKRIIGLFIKKSSSSNRIPPDDTGSSPTYYKIDTKKIKISSLELELDIYGSLDNPLFDFKPFSNSLRLPTLNDTIVTKYENNIDYKIDSSNIYLTYAGVLKTLFMFSKSNTALNFKKWYDSTFTERNKYVNTVVEVFSKFELSCIYLLHIGEYKGYKNVYKFGRTDNFIRRYKELNKTYGCLFKIHTLHYIDPEYLSKAESEVSKLVTEYIVKIDNYTELFSIEDITSIVQKFKDIGIKYSMNNREMKEQYNELLNKNKLLEMELALANSLKDLANEKLRNYE